MILSTCGAATEVSIRFIGGGSISGRRRFFIHFGVSMSPKTRFSMAGLPLLSLLAVIGLGCSQRQSKDEMLSTLPAELRETLGSVDRNTPMVSSGVNHPAFVRSDAVSLREIDRVIGVVTEGHARAYPLTRMSSLLEHVVNDHVLDSTGQPKAFTVTYCNLTECVRVLESSDGGGGDNLEIGTLGLNDGGLMLYRANERFKQEEPVAALRDVPFELMTWGEWKAKHPETEVYVGPSNRNQPAGSSEAVTESRSVSP